jgi:phosphatidylglycerophosphatase A
VSGAARRADWRFVLSDPAHLLAFGFGAGLAPKAPGTVGTLLGVPLVLALQGAGPVPYAAACLFAFLLGCWAAERTSRHLGVHDHGGIVWDEVVGYMLTMAALPDGPGWLMAGFVSFRALDIIKPWPISWLDARVRGGCGIMLDDVAAGVGAGLLVWGGGALVR